MRKSFFFILVGLLCINLYAQEYTKCLAKNGYSDNFRSSLIATTQEILIRASSSDCISVIFRFHDMPNIDIVISCSNFYSISSILDKYVQWKKLASDNNTTVVKDLGIIYSASIIDYLYTNLDGEPKKDDNIFTHTYAGDIRFIFNKGDFALEFPKQKYTGGYLFVENTTENIDNSVIESAASSLTGDNLIKLKADIKSNLELWNKFK